MQVPLITHEGAKPKGRLSYLSALVITSLAVVMPVRLRITFSIVINFLYNHIFATTRMGMCFAARLLTHALIFLTYYLVLGPISLLVRLFGADYMRTSEAEGSLFLMKEPEDSSEERFERQF